METINFVHMEDGTREEYELTVGLFKEHNKAHLADSVLAMLEQMKGAKCGYKVDRYTHSLQSATRAERDGADEETIVTALLHDIGDIIAPHNHSQLAASVLRPFVSERNYWVVQHHGLFQGYYYYHHFDRDRHARDRFKDHPHYQACVDFCQNWDQNCFDPDYDTLPLAHFEPMVRRLFAKEPQGFD